MNLGLLTGLGALVIAAFVGWLKYEIARSRKARIRAEISEKTASDISNGLKVVYEANSLHEQRISEIYGGVDDDRAGELLSASPKIPKISRVKPSRARNSLSKKMR